MSKIKVLTIIGARPQIIKAAAISRAIRRKYSDQIHEILIHTGQHYDENMSKVFFDELEIPEPDYNLGIGSSNHANQTADMLKGIADLLVKERPDLILLYGDTNSTLAAALAASKLHIPIVHVEGGLRSMSKVYPEEINRIMTDHVSAMIFTPTLTGFNHLLREGFNAKNVPKYTIDNPGIFHCGDIMYDNSLYFSELASRKTNILNDHQLQKNNYILATIHRDVNTDFPERLSAIFETFLELAELKGTTFVLPLHPRTLKKLKESGSSQLFQRLQNSLWIKILPPASFLEITELEKNAKLVITDSGGVQKEAFYFKRPCIIVLKETPWVELVECGAAKLTDADPSRIKVAFDYYFIHEHTGYPEYFGSGNASEFICEEIVKNFKTH